MADRPGFMMYFDFAPALSKLTDEEAGTLFKAIMDYASSGTIHDLPGTCGFAFEVLRPRIDNDRAAYEERCRKNSYSTYIREMKKRNEQPLDYEAWCEKTSSDIARYRTISSDNERYPTTTTTSTTKTTTTATSSSTATTAKPKPISSPRRGEKDRSELIAVAEELAFEDMRRRKLNMLSGLMASG